MWRQARAGVDRPEAVSDAELAGAIDQHAEPFDSLQDLDLEPLLRRMGDVRVVLLGEASHGTSEFYTLRERITRELITRKGFSFVAIEGDWPDAARIDQYVRGGMAHLDVAQRRGAGFCGVAAGAQRAGSAAGGLSWSRSVQPLQLD